MARTDTETAFGGLMLGIAMPLALFGVGVAIDTVDLLGLRDEPLVMPFGALIFIGAVMLGTSGATLLWWNAPAEMIRVARKPAAVKVLKPVKQRARRREVPMVAKIAPKPKPRQKPPAPVLALSFSDQSLVTLTPTPIARDALSTAQLPLGASRPESTTKLVAFAGTQRKIRIVAGA